MRPTFISYSKVSTIPETQIFDLAPYMGLIILMSIASYAISAWLLSRIFRKAGIEEWKAWVPLYNYWIILEMGGQKGWYLLLSLIPFVGSVIFLVFYIMAVCEIGKKFGKDGIFVLWAIFVPIVWYAILAFDKSTWLGQTQSTTATTTPTPQYVPAQPVAAPSEQISNESIDQTIQNQ